MSALRRSAISVAVSLALAIPMSSLAQTDRTFLANVPIGTAPANGGSTATVTSANGRYVAFQSAATNLVSGDTNGVIDVFLYDRESNSVSLISKSSTGAIGNAMSFEPSISADGRYVMFASDASNLVAGDTNNRTDSFVHDRNTGQTIRVSVGTDGSQHNFPSIEGAISSDGRYAAFRTFAAFDPADLNSTTDIYLRDIVLGTTTWITKTAAGNSSHSGISFPAMSGDGTVIGFTSPSGTFVAGDTNNVTDVFTFDRKTNAMQRVSVSSSGLQANQGSATPALNQDGTRIAFATDASNLVSGDVNAQRDVVIYDRTNSTLSLVSISDTGARINGSSQNRRAFSVSADGRYVVFQTPAPNVVAGDTNTLADLFIRDTIANRTERVSLTNFETAPNGQSVDGTISADGRWVGFRSFATNMVSAPVIGSFSNVYLRDRVTNEPPVANAGGDRTVEATAILTPVVLDGSASTDPDGDNLLYTWSGSFGVLSGVTVSPTFALGNHAISLTVDDSNGGLASDAITVSVVDTTAPVLSIPSDVVVVASGPLSAINIGSATATDIFPFVISNDAPSYFPVGETLVTWVAEDENGNRSEGIQRVLAHYAFDGFFGPLKKDKEHNEGRTLPVKFKLSYADGSPVENAQIQILLDRVINGVPVGSPEPAMIKRSKNEDGKYQVLVETAGLAAGDYLLMLDAGDGNVPYSTTVSLRSNEHGHRGHHEKSEHENHKEKDKDKDKEKDKEKSKNKDK